MKNTKYKAGYSKIKKKGEKVINKMQLTNLNGIKSRKKNSRKKKESS